jgi:transposase InsO family protein
VARAYEVSRYWVQRLVQRYLVEGEAAYRPRSRRPQHSPHAVPAGVEDEIVRLRKELTRQGLDAGADTIRSHLARGAPRSRPDQLVVPAVSTIWRILARRGFVTPQPQKRPRSSWQRFAAEQPNERWQADTTHWQLADGTPVETRPHRAIGRNTPWQSYTARPKATATGPVIDPHWRVRHDRIDTTGTVTLRHNSRLHHISLGRRLASTRVTLLVDDLHIRVINRDTGELIRELTLDPTRDFQPRGVPPGPVPKTARK